MIWRRILLLSSIVALAVASVHVARQGYGNALRAPVVRRADIRLADYPAGTRPVVVALLSDIHVHGPDMPPERVASIVDGVNALHPDVILIAGDFIGNNWVGSRFPIDDAVRPLQQLRAPTGVFAVLGNNDHRADAGSLAAALAKAGVRVLEDAAVRSGPLVLGGLDDRADKRRVQFRLDQWKLFSAMRRLDGAKILLTHRPDVFPQVPTDISLTLAGHTHCGQLVLPLIGPILTGSRFGTRYMCGIRYEHGRMLIVTGGLGTSHVPLRWRAPPDVWLITIHG